MKAPTRRTRQGFTLAELLVASTLVSLVMVALYGGFNTTIRTWRLGEGGMYKHQDVRVALGILQRELQSTVGRADYLFEGDIDEIEFFTLSPSLDPGQGAHPRLMWVRYRTRPDRGGRARVLVREEAEVTGRFPARARDGERVERSAVKKGRERTFDLLEGVVGFEIRYYWHAYSEAGFHGRTAPPPWFEAKEERRHEQGWGLPSGLQVFVAVEDASAEHGMTMFPVLVAFNGNVSYLGTDRLEGYGEVVP